MVTETVLSHGDFEYLIGSSRKRAMMTRKTETINMKFGLLVVLAVAVLVPSLSEGRIVSRCELKEKLGQAMTLPPQLQKFKEEYLAKVICEVNRRSSLNTGLVKVFGKRTTTTKATPTTTVTTLAPRVNGTTAAPTTTQLNTTETTTTAPTTTQTTTTQLPITPTPPNRRKRGVSSEESDSAEMHSSQGELLNEGDEVRSQGVNGTVDEDGDKAKGSDNRDEDEDEDEDEDSDERDEEEGGKRKKRSKEDRSSEDRSSEETKHSSLGLYGIFQLSDETFCNSGYRSSKNKCNTTCDAFTDDDILDDITCFVKTNQWGSFLKSSSGECHYRIKNYFEECK
ncbi:transcription initiation factor TFIID subunit 11-like [Perca flavescens]|uniref:transcription initiation factor TFIID subunit 11-like n=1 Tax=Perca flavescens TaxID=8167 RepID=UPI00106E2757|nr:transcription initiation factor TFIID subunit 11-like [Perca flavescens]